MKRLPKQLQKHHSEVELDLENNDYNVVDIMWDYWTPRGMGVPPKQVIAETWTDDEIDDFMTEIAKRMDFAID